MVGTDESTELWRHPQSRQIFVFRWAVGRVVTSDRFAVRIQPLANFIYLQLYQMCIEKHGSWSSLVEVDEGLNRAKWQAVVIKTNLKTLTRQHLAHISLIVHLFLLKSSLHGSYL